MPLPMSAADMVQEQIETEHRRMVEAQREIQRQRMFAIQQAVRTQGPAVDGILWNRGRPEDRPRIPILSILTFKLKPTIDILDVSQAPRKLWDSSLQYIRSIPGCMLIEWGRAVDDSTVALCIIQWESAMAWQYFQQSLGFGLVVGLLAANVSNCCLKFQPGSVTGMEGNGAILEKICFTFDSEISPAFRETFDADWSSLIASSTNQNLISVRSGWLEQNASDSHNPNSEQVAASKIPAVFTGLLVWHAAGYDSQTMALPCRTLGDKVFAEVKANLSRIAIRLIQSFQNQDVGPLSAPVPLAHNSIASILKVEIPKKFNREHRVWHNTDQTAYESIEAAKQGQRRFPAPWGSFHPQGELCQDKMPIVPQLQDLPRHHSDRNFIVDVVWLRFDVDAIPPHTTTVPYLTQATIKEEDLTDPLRNLHADLSRLSGYEAAFWARDMEELTAFAFLTVWKDPATRGASIQQYYQTVEAFAASSSNHLAAQLRHQAFPLRRGIHLNFIPYLELMSFNVPSGELNRQLFEQAYVAFERTTVLQTAAGVRTACRLIAAGGWEPDPPSGQGNLMGMQQFTGVLAWEDQAASQEWYGDFFKSATSSYERLGHKLDALKSVMAGGVESRFLLLARFEV